MPDIRDITTLSDTEKKITQRETHDFVWALKRTTQDVAEQMMLKEDITDIIFINIILNTIINFGIPTMLSVLYGDDNAKAHTSLLYHFLNALYERILQCYTGEECPVTALIYNQIEALKK